MKRVHVNHLLLEENPMKKLDKIVMELFFVFIFIQKSPFPFLILFDFRRKEYSRFSFTYKSTPVKTDKRKHCIQLSHNMTAMRENNFHTLCIRALCRVQLHVGRYREVAFL